MDKPEFSCAILSKLDLDDIEKVVKEAYHKIDGPGRPPRKPMGIFKALIVARALQLDIFQNEFPLASESTTYLRLTCITRARTSY